MNKNIVVETQYFPCIHLIQQFLLAENLLIEQHENYQKISFRNRCTIAGSNGLITLSVPLKDGRNQKKIITEVEIDNTTNWQYHHIKTIQSCYAKAPFFDSVFPILQSLLFKKHHYLIDLNNDVLQTIFKLFKSTTSIQSTKNYQTKYDNVIDFRNQILPKNHQQYAATTQYQQVFQQKNLFYNNLSIVDYLFCNGNKF